ncbi:MAG: endonuclease IV [candidate division Zixibacteria bacterium DG_27]|nr:MAG: endonuclease IV [candidate division Zixibacteria bacterium DG_27]
MSSKKILLGAHMSIAGGVYNCFDHGEHFKCTTIQIFTKSSNQWRAKPLTEEEIATYKRRQRETGISPVVAHNSYLINLGSNDKALLEKSKEAFLVEIERCELLEIPYLVMHPGAHTGAGEAAGIKTIADSLSWLHHKSPKAKVMICLETTAGQGTNLGYRFEQIARIIESTDSPDRLGVCFDTCHTFAAGYDIRTEKAYRKTMREFDSVIGLMRLKVIHFNDCKKELGSRVDRHAHIGEGFIGVEPFGFFMNDRRFAKTPKILETPKGDDGSADDRNLTILRNLVREKKK